MDILHACMHCILAVYICVGGVITDLTAVQTTLNTVRVTWTAPPGPPKMYQIMVDASDVDFDTTATESPYSLNTSELGVHTVQVMYTSQHFPNEEAVTVDVTVDGEGDSSHEYCHTLHVYTQVSMEHLSLHHH